MLTTLICKIKNINKFKKINNLKLLEYVSILSKYINIKRWDKARRGGIKLVLSCRDILHLYPCPYSYPLPIFIRKSSSYYDRGKSRTLNFS